ncbi:MAG: carbon-nitrogen hydrolase family protein, partial [Chthoniobacterales bacterium]
MKIAAAQIDCVPGEVETNLRTLERFAAQAREAGAALVVFPELSDTGYDMSAVRRTAQPWAEGAVPRLCALAQRLSLAILCGVSEHVDDAIFNSQVLIDASGAITGSYRKCHLFRAGTFDEGTTLSEGGALVACDFGGFRLGLTICYDLRFPEIFRALATEQVVN